MTDRLFLPCAAGAEPWLVQEAARITGAPAVAVRGGVAVEGGLQQAMQLNLHSRIAQRVLLQLMHGPYRHEDDLYGMAHRLRWPDWFTVRQTLRVDVTAHRSPLRSLNFATLRIKDGIVDAMRSATGARPSVDTARPDVRIFVHLDETQATIYLDTSGEPLFKRGWREDKGEAPLKETLAAAMLAASEWDALQPLLDPCCGSGTIAIEAAQIACGVAPGLQRRFGFERLARFDHPAWQQLREQAQAAKHAPSAPLFAGDVSFRMVDFARRNAERAGVGQAIRFGAGDATQRPAPSDHGLLLLNPPYGERIAAQGSITRRRQADGETVGDDFFTRLAAHWKRAYAGWTAWILSPDAALPSQMRLKAARRIPMWNGPIECRLFRFDLVAGSMRERRAEAPAGSPAPDPGGA